jgi:hypothetical protein
MPALPITLYTANDFAAKVRLRTMDPVTGVVTPLTTGTVSAFFSLSNGPGAVAADPALTMSATHLGDGVWFIFFDAGILTAPLLDPLFAASPPYLIVEQPGGVRVYAPVTYAPSRPATVGYL